MSHKIIEAASGEGVSLSESDGERINVFLGIEDKRKNLSDEQKLILQQVCQLVSQGQSVEGAIALVGSTDNSKSISESVIDGQGQLPANDITNDTVLAAGLSDEG